MKQVLILILSAKLLQQANTLTIRIQATALTWYATIRMLTTLPRLYRAKCLNYIQAATLTYRVLSILPVTLSR